VDADTGWQGKAQPYRSGSRVAWTTAAGINGGTIFLRVSRLDKIWGDGITSKAIWHVVKAAAKRAEIKNFAPHDCVAPVLGYAIWRVEDLSRFGSCLDTHRFRQLSGICASRGSTKRNDYPGLEET
jgi:hypothetical protein